MKYHEAADAFPMMPKERFEALKADIKQNGLHQSLTICGGKILDGRNRYKACEELGITPTTVEFDGDPWAYVWSLNGERRDLADDVRAAILIDCNEKSEQWQAKIAEIAAAGNEKRSKAAKEQHKTSKPYAGEKLSKDGGSTTCTPTKKNPSRKALAKAANINEGALARAAALRKKRPDLDEKVRKGELTPAAARREANKGTKKNKPATKQGKAKASRFKDDAYLPLCDQLVAWIKQRSTKRGGAKAAHECEMLSVQLRERIELWIQQYPT